MAQGLEVLPASRNITGCFANHCDWRLPSHLELQGILDRSAPGCGSGAPCIDPVFGPTQADYYWSATSLSTADALSIYAWDVGFGNTFVDFPFKPAEHYVRAVRGGL